MSMDLKRDTSPTMSASREVASQMPDLLLEPQHELCPGCGEPLALRAVLEVIDELGLTEKAISVMGIGCYTAFASTVGLDLVQALHGRAPCVATGVKRMRPDTAVFTLQGDGDMANEGLQDLLHTAARGEAVTCLMLNNGVFGETGGHMTATSVLGQRTKNTIEGRDASRDGYPLRVSDLVASLDGAAYVARGSVHNPGAVRRTRSMIRRAFETQSRGDGFSLVEILTMCPTGWFLKTSEGPSYLKDTIEPTHRFGELKADRWETNHADEGAGPAPAAR
jgi:2-oxoglutarate ferredoxin oxidoreductase subunit beta